MPLIQDRLTTVKLISGRDGDPTYERVLLHEVNMTLEQLSYTIGAPMPATALEALPDEYGPKISFHYGIENNRIFRFVEVADTALAMGSGESQGDYTDIDAVHIAVCTGTSAAGDVFTASFEAYLGRFLGEFFVNEFDQTSPLVVVDNVDRVTGELGNLDLEAVIDSANNTILTIVDPSPELVEVLAFSFTEDEPELTEEAPTIAGYYGAEGSMLGTPDMWIKLTWPAAPEGFVLIPAYFPVVSP